MTDIKEVERQSDIRLAGAFIVLLFLVYGLLVFTGQIVFVRVEQHDGPWWEDPEWRAEMAVTDWIDPDFVDWCNSIEHRNPSCEKFHR